MPLDTASIGPPRVQHVLEHGRHQHQHRHRRPLRLPASGKARRLLTTRCWCCRVTLAVVATLRHCARGCCWWCYCCGGAALASALGMAWAIEKAKAGVLLVLPSCSHATVSYPCAAASKPARRRLVRQRGASTGWPPCCTRSALLTAHSAWPCRCRPPMLSCRTHGRSHDKKPSVRPQFACDAQLDVGQCAHCRTSLVARAAGAAAGAAG